MSVSALRELLIASTAFLAARVTMLDGPEVYIYVSGCSEGKSQSFA